MIFLGNIVGFSVFSTVGDTNIELYVGVFSTLLWYGSNLIFKKCYCGGEGAKIIFSGIFVIGVDIQHNWMMNLECGYP